MKEATVTSIATSNGRQDNASPLNSFHKIQSYLGVIRKVVSGYFHRSNLLQGQHTNILFGNVFHFPPNNKRTHASFANWWPTNTVYQYYVEHIDKKPL